MKKQIILAFAMLLVFGLGTATFANTISCSCCKDDSCPMKQKDSSGKETAACCDDCDCCKGASVKTVGAYFKGQPLYHKTGKSACKCGGAKS
jgi:hypothetical protein